MLAFQKLKFACMFPYQEKVSDFNILTRQNWISLIETVQEKGNNYPLYVTVGCKVMKLWPTKVCQNPGQNHSAHAQMEFLVISVLNIFKWLFPTKTESVSFYSLSPVLSDSVSNFI